MSKKKFVLRIDEDQYVAIERWANDEFRSVNGQIEWMLAQMLRESGRNKAKAEAKAKAKAKAEAKAEAKAKEEENR